MGPKRYRCVLCKDPEHIWGLEFESHEPQCPRCQASGNFAIIPLVNVHLYVQDQKHGPILSEHGRRLKVACKPDATNPHGVPCSGEATAVTCPACKATREYQEALEKSQATAGGILLQ